MTRTSGRGGTGRVLTPEQAPGINLQGRRRLLVLWNRIEFLEKCISEHNGNPGFYIAEVTALRWLLEEAEMPAPPRENHG